MKRYLISAAFLAGLGFTACDGNDEPAKKPDTADTAQPDTTQPDSVLPDSITPRDIDATEPQATVKYARTIGASITCDPSSITDIEPQFTLENVVVTSPKYRAGASASPETHFGYFVADQDGGAYSGIVLRFSADTQPSPDLVPGDVITVSGQLKDAFCTTQLDVSTVTKGSPVAPPTPVTVVPTSDVAQEAFESMLVKVTNVKVNASGTSGVYDVDGTSLQISYLFPSYFLNLTPGDTYEEVTGVLRYAFNKWQLIPRSANDIKGGSVSQISAIQNSAPSTSCSSTGRVVHGNHTIEGTLQTGRFSASGNLFGYYLTDGTTDPYSGIMLVQFKEPTPAAEFVKGDRVRVTGQHLEYFCLTEFQISSIEKIGDGGTLPEPAVIDKTITKADLEQWEGVLVEVANVAAGEFVTSVNGQNVYFVDTDTNFKIDSLLIGSSFQNGAAITNKTLTTLRGIVRYSFDEYRISPRSAADWVIAE